ncbi:MAG: HNH endonuclease [Sulfuricella sp.]
MSAKLTASRARELLAYDPETGIITWRVAKSPRAPAGAAAGYVQDADGQIKIRIDGRLYQASHLAILLATGVMPVGVVKHLDGDNGNNRIGNLEWDAWLAKQENGHG